jgi:hypothetical protein
VAWLACGAALGAAAAEESLGTLFLTPDERARLDRARRGEPVVPDAPGAAHGSDPQLTGYVQRSDGRTSVWIDGRALRLPARSTPRLEPDAVHDEADSVRIERRPTR